MDATNHDMPVSSWRTSKRLVVFTAILALFTENFLYAFVIPILPYMIEGRLRLDPSYTQRFTTELLVIMGLVSIPAAPIIGHFADKTPSRKIPLLIGLAGCTAGTLLVALTPSVGAMYVGRILQGIAGSATWIVGFAMLTDATASENLGKALGFAGSFITAGIITGPAVAGVLLEWLGYWPAWMVPFVLLIIDFAARLAMIEVPQNQSKDKPTETESHANEPQEDAPLLDGRADDSGTTNSVKPASKPGFWTILLRQGSAYSAVLNVIAFAMILSGFDATLPIHLRDAFGWSSAPIGSIFLAFQIPGMFLAPVVGWIRDRYGLRWPTVAGWTLAAPLLWFSGVPGPDNFLGVGAGTRGQSIFVACMICFGIVVSFARGAGTFQLTTTLRELRANDPEIFGPNGGGSRMFSVTEGAFSTGLLLGPLLCGSLADAVGFYYTSCALALIALAVAVSSLAFFTRKAPVREPLAEEASGAA